MIQANELRIGNHILRNGFLQEDKNKFNAIIVTPNDIIACAIDSSSFKPIPLTEEWLLKFGAIKYETLHDNQYRIGDRLFVIRDGVIHDYGTSVKLKYVHRFQNFMYELTTQELTINQP